MSTALYSDIDEGDTDAQKAARWAVEQDLMKDDADNNKFHPAFPVSKLRTCLTWNAANEQGLFAKTEEKKSGPRRGCCTKCGAAAPFLVFGCWNCARPVVY